MSQAALNTRNHEEEDETSSRRSNGSRLAGIFFLLAVLLGVLILRSINRPVRGLVAAIRRFQAGDYDTAIPHADSRDELGEIVRLMLGATTARLASRQIAVEGQRARPAEPGPERPGPDKGRGRSR